MSAVTAESVASLTGNFKEAYGEVIADLVPQSDILFKRVKFVREQGKDGLAYNQPVLIQLASSMSWGTGAVSLNPVVPSMILNATLTGTQLVTRDAIQYNMVVRSLGSKAAFRKGAGLVIENLYKTHGKAAELDMLYGAGAITSGVSLAQSVSAVAASANAAITITYASWAPATFSGFTGAPIDVYQSGSQLNTVGPLTIVSLNANPASSSVGGVLTVSGNSADIAAVIAASGAAAMDLYWFNAYGNNMTGLKGILQNTGSLFGINAATYDLWKANSYNANNTQLTFSKLQQAVSEATGRGLDEDVTTLCNPTTFADLVSEQAGARRFDTSYKPKNAENGMETIKFHSSSGINEVLPHMFVHQGDAFIYPEPQLVKIGAADGIVDSLEGLGQLFLQVPDASVAEVRLLSDFGLLCMAPAKCVLVSNITNSISA